MDGVANGAILLLAQFDDGSGPAIFAFGSFRTIDLSPGRITTPNAARWDTTGWHAFPMQHDSYFWPRDTVAFDDGTGEKLYLGGWVDKINGVVVLSGSSRGLLDGMLCTFGYPQTAFASSVEFNHWWQEQAESLEWFKLDCLSR